MDTKQRILEIKKVIEISNRENKENNSLLKIERMWKGDLTIFPVYQIPLNLLVYNKYNGRILSRTKSLETQKEQIDVSSKEGAAIIAKLLYESKPEANKKTEKDLLEYGQKEIAMITRDGVIIDGNRRAMLLNRIKKYDYLKTIVLNVSAEEDPLEIEKLETSFQMGSDEKLSYNPIEKYLKTKTLVEKLTSGIDSRSEKEAIENISDWMQESPSDVKFMLSVMKTMDDYLSHHDYHKLYIQLDRREEQFRNLTKWLKNYRGGESVKAFDGYSDLDVDDLQVIGFDFIRAGYEGKEFRVLAEGLRENHFFGDKDIWKNFVNGWEDIIGDDYSKISLSKPNFSSNNLKANLDAIDLEFKNQVLEKFEEIVNEGRNALQRTKHKEKPKKLLKNIKGDLGSLNLNQKGLSDELKTDVVNETKQASVSIINKIYKHSMIEGLNVIIDSLNNINNDDNYQINNKNEIKDKLSEIRKILFDIGKKI